MKKPKFDPASVQLKPGGTFDYLYRMFQGVINCDTPAISHMWDSLDEEAQAFAILMFSDPKLRFLAYQSREKFIHTVATHMATKATQREVYDTVLGTYMRMSLEERELCIKLMIEQYYDELMDIEIEYHCD